MQSRPKHTKPSWRHIRSYTEGDLHERVVKSQPDGVVDIVRELICKYKRHTSFKILDLKHLSHHTLGQGVICFSSDALPESMMRQVKCFGTIQGFHG